MKKGNFLQTLRRIKSDGYSWKCFGICSSEWSYCGPPFSNRFACNIEFVSGFLICFAIIALVNLGMGIMSFVQGYGIENGSLTFGSINLFCGIMILVIMGAIWCKHIKDSWEEY